MSLIALGLLCAKGAAVLLKAGAVKAVVVKTGAYVVTHYTTAQIATGIIATTAAVGAAKTACDAGKAISDGIKKADSEKIIDGASSFTSLASDLSPK